MQMDANGFYAYSPPRRTVLLGLAAACAALCLGFVVVLVVSLRAPAAVVQTDYSDATPEAMRWEISGIDQSGDTLAILGWACVENERFESVDIRPALMGRDGKGWMLPTVLREDETARQAAGDVVFGEYGGFTGRCDMGSIPPGSYEVCIAYDCNGLRTLIHTGRTVEVEE